MKFLILHTTDPYLNLAVEEYLFRHENGEVFALWQNEPTVVIGKNQNAYTEVDLDYLRAAGIHLARRITGGGAVYHDLGNVNYTFISKTGENGIDFARFTAPITEALRHFGVPAVLSGRNDLLVGEKKFSGNAQYSQGGRTLHHGTLLFDSDMNVLSRVLRPDEEKIRSKAVKSVRARVTNLAPLLPRQRTAGEFIAAIADFVKARFSPEVVTAPQNEEIERLRARNASDEWLFPARDLVTRYTVTKKARYPFGTVELSLDMDGESIARAAIRGDFFGSAPVEELETFLCGKTVAEALAALTDDAPDKYIHGMSKADLAALLDR